MLKYRNCHYNCHSRYVHLPFLLRLDLTTDIVDSPGPSNRPSVSTPTSQQGAACLLEDATDLSSVVDAL